MSVFWANWHACIHIYKRCTQKQRNHPNKTKKKPNSDAWKWQKTISFLSSRNSVWTCLSSFFDPSELTHFCCSRSSSLQSHHKLTHISVTFSLFLPSTHKISQSICFGVFLSLSCFGMATSINLSSFRIAVFESSSVFQRSSSNQRVTLVNGTGAGNTLHIYQQAISYFSCDFSISVPCSLSQSPSASYPLRSWWAPGGAAAWSRRTPAPRCPPSAAPLSPRSRSTSLHPRPTPRHHTPTRTRSPSRPPRPRDHRQDQRSHPAPHSSSPAPTPALHRPTRTGRAPPGTRLLPARSLNPVWVRLRWDEVESKKYWPQVCEEPEVIKDLSGLEGVTWNEKKADSKRNKVHTCWSQCFLLSFSFLSSQMRRHVKAHETLLFSDSLWLSFALSGTLTASLQSKGREDEREWIWVRERAGRGDETEAEGRCGATVGDAQPLMSYTLTLDM